MMGGGNDDDYASRGATAGEKARPTTSGNAGGGNATSKSIDQFSRTAEKLNLNLMDTNNNLRNPYSRERGT